MQATDLHIQDPHLEDRDSWERVSMVIPIEEWVVAEPVIAEINQLKTERNALVLAHNYMTPDIFHGVADIVGDSLGLAQAVVASDADVIVLAGVHFMAETAKITNPEKTVLIPDESAGCSLAEGITGADVRPPQAALSGCTCRYLREYVRRSEGRMRHHLHQLQRGRGRGIAGSRQGDIRARPVPRYVRRLSNGR